MASKEWPAKARTEWAVHVVADDGIESFGFPSKKAAEGARRDMREMARWVSSVVPLTAGLEYWVVHVGLDGGQMKSFGFEKRAEANTFRRQVRRAEPVEIVSEATKAELTSEGWGS
jgi:hypothetical protein